MIFSYMLYVKVMDIRKFGCAKKNLDVNVPFHYYTRSPSARLFDSPRPEQYQNR